MPRRLVITIWPIEITFQLLYYRQCGLDIVHAAKVKTTVRHTTATMSTHDTPSSHLQTRPHSISIQSVFVICKLPFICVIRLAHTYASTH